MEKNSKIAVFGASGLVGKALVRELHSQGYERVFTPTHHEVDLLDPVATRWWLSCYTPEFVFLLAARVGGIHANIADPLGFFLDNINIEQNVMREAVRYNAKKLLFLGSSCVYPENASNPIIEDDLLTGPFTPEVEAYGLAKVCGIRMCQWIRKQTGKNFVSAMPCNLFGEGDHYNLHYSHCIPGLIARMDYRKSVGAPGFPVWGSGQQKREFLYTPDLAKMLIAVMEKYDDPEPINVGSGFELTMLDLAVKIAALVGYEGTLEVDPLQPQGKIRKLLCNEKIRGIMGPDFKLTNFDAALHNTYLDYLKQHES